MKKWFKRLKNQKGMTLVELLAVVVILGIVAAIAVPSISNIIDNSKKDAHKSNALLVINAAKLGVASNDKEVSDSVKLNTGITLQTLVTEGFLDAVPADPSNKGKSYDPTASIVKYSSTNGYSITLVKHGGGDYYSNVTERTINDGTAKLKNP